MEEENELSTQVDSLLDQLRSVPKVAQKVQEMYPTATQENIEQFIIDYSSKLIINATESVEHVRDIVTSAPTPQDITALAELIASTSSALETLNRLNINNKKLKQALTIKEMEIKAKKDTQEITNNTIVIASREEVMKNLINSAKIIEIESSEPKQLKDAKEPHKPNAQ